jgi:hypothetical protein
MTNHYGYPPLAEQSCTNCRYHRHHRDESICAIRAPDLTAGGMMPLRSICNWCGEWAPGEPQR